MIKIAECAVQRTKNTRIEIKKTMHEALKSQGYGGNYAKVAVYVDENVDGLILRPVKIARIVDE